MDPNLFHIDRVRLFEVLIPIVVLLFLVERALALFSESRFFINKPGASQERRVQT